MTAPAAVGVPIERAALCLDCNTIVRLEADACPACGSATTVPLHRFLERPAVVHWRQALAGGDVQVSLQEVLHHAGNGLTPARVHAEQLLPLLEAVALTRNAALDAAARGRVERIIRSIDDTMQRLTALAVAPTETPG